MGMTGNFNGPGPYVVDIPPPVSGAGISVTPPTRDSDGIDIAMSMCVAAGGGTVRYEAADYQVTRRHTPSAGVSHIGAPAILQMVGNIPDAGFSVIGGTRLIVAAGVTAFGYNTDDQGTLPNPLAPTGLRNITMANLSFVGGRAHIKMGARNILGPLWCRFEELYSFDSDDFGFDWLNFQHCTWRNIYQSKSAEGGGGVRWGVDGCSPTLLPGNSTIEGEVYTYCTGRTNRSIVFEARNGGQLNQLLVTARIQGNRYGASTATPASATFTAASNVVSVPNDAEFALLQVGMPVYFASTAPQWYNLNQVYYVASRNAGAKTVQLADWPLTTNVITANTSGTHNLSVGGYPCIEIHADDTSLFTASYFGQADVEGTHCTAQISVRRTRNCDMDLLEGFQGLLATVSARDANLGIEVNDPALFRADWDTNSQLAIRNSNSRRRTVTASATASFADHQSEISVNNAGATNYTINSGLAQGFETTLVQLGAGQVTVTAGSGVTINSRNGLKTAGQFARLQIRQTARNTYVVSGDSAV